jgi:hypothetical protein
LGSNDFSLPLLVNNTVTEVSVSEAISWEVAMPTSEFVSTVVGDLHVQREGAGPPAVFWHSLFVDSTTWNGLRRRPSRAHDHRVLGRPAPPQRRGRI